MDTTRGAVADLVDEINGAGCQELGQTRKGDDVIAERSESFVTEGVHANTSSLHQGVYRTREDWMT